MKKALLIFCLILSVILLGSVCLAASDHITFEDMEIGTQPFYFNVVEKQEETGGKILVSGDSSNKYLNFKIIKPKAATANDSYIQVNNVVHNERLEIDLFVQPIHLNKGQFSVYLRDSTAMFISLFKFSGSLFTAIPDFNNPEHSCNISPTQWYLVRVTVDFINQKFTVRLNDHFRVEQSFAQWHKSFNNENYAVRFDHKILSYNTSDTSEVNIDNIYLGSVSPSNELIKVTPPNIYKNIMGVEYKIDGFDTGHVILKSTVINVSNQYQRINVYLAQYKNERLVGILKEQVEVAKNQAVNITKSLVLTEDLDAVKAFYFDDDLYPFTSSFVIGKRHKTVPFPMEIIEMLKQNNPNKSHPRLIVKQERFDLIDRKAGENPEVGSWKAAILQYANGILNSTPVGYDIYDGLRLNTSNSSSIISLAFAYKISRDSKYADKMMEYIQVTASYPDWNDVAHFLDAATLAVSFAVAYDWCYDYLDDSQKNLIKETLRTHILIPALNAYERDAWWVAGTNNWCVVCNSGILLSALSVGDEEGLEELAGIAASKAISSMRNALPLFAPDGAWFEGPAYWAYTVSYLAYYVSTLQSALGTDLGTMNSAGVSLTGYFPVYMTGSTNQTFNLHDANESIIDSPEIGWLGSVTSDINLSKYRYYQLKKLNYSVKYKDLLWLDFRVLTEPVEINLPPDRMFRDSEVASMRSRFFDTNSAFAALHGGVNNIPHGSLDIGMFIYEVLGERWAIDLGPDNYNLHGYFDNSHYRWWYYRNRAEGHNVIVMNPDENILTDQDLDGEAKITALKSGVNASYAIVDTSSAYKKYVERSQRGLYLDKQTGAAIVQDEIIFQSDKTIDLYWYMHTKAEINISADGKSAVLTQNGKSIWVGIVAPDNVTFTVQDAVPRDTSPDPNQLIQNKNNTPPNPTTQNPNVGIRKLVVNDKGASGTYCVSVALVPLEEGQTVPAVIPQYSPVLNWTAR